MILTDKQRLGKRFIKRGIVYVWSEELQLMFHAGVNDPRNKKLECMASAFEELHRQYSIRPRKRVAQ
jgi:hypothetical protein